MSAAVFFYQESMNQAELSYLTEKRDKERRVFMRVLRTLSVIFIVLPCCISIIMEGIVRSNDTPEALKIKEREEPHIYLFYFLGMIFLLLVVAVASYFSYSRTLKMMERDIRQGEKTVEQTSINRKMAMGNGTYHFYLNSAYKLSIEVTAEEYADYQEGDEINIEYSTWSGIYFGYF